MQPTWRTDRFLRGTASVIFAALVFALGSITAAADPVLGDVEFTPRAIDDVGPDVYLGSPVFFTAIPESEGLPIVRYTWTLTHYPSPTPVEVWTTAGDELTVVFEIAIAPPLEAISPFSSMVSPELP